VTDELSKGTFRCDVCGLDTPHPHGEYEVEEARLIRPAFETWQYAFSNEFVYLNESLCALRDTRDIPSEVYGKLHGRMEIQFVLEGDRDGYYKALVCSIDAYKSAGLVFPAHLREVNNRSASVGGDTSMFVEIAHFVKPPQRMRFVMCPSVIWLKRINFANGFCGDASQTFIEADQAILGQNWSIDNWKSDPFWNASDSCQSPNQLVQTRPHIVDSIGCYQTDMHRNIQEAKPEDVPSMFKIVLTRQSIGIRICKLANFRAKKLEMSLCPSKFRLSIDTASEIQDGAQRIVGYD